MRFLLVVVVLVVADTAALVLQAPRLPPPRKVEHPVLEPILLSPDKSLDTKLDEIGQYYSRKPWLVVARLASVTAAAVRVAFVWTTSREEFDLTAARLAKSRGGKAKTTKRGRELTTQVSRLGVVFIKLAQTLATRPDIIGEEAAAALETLQDRNAPFDDDMAKDIIRNDLEQVFQLHNISERPLAAASLAQVYRARSVGGADVAIKVRRPKVVEQVARDSYAIRIALRALQSYWGTNSTDYPGIVDEVTAGLFRELDFRLEAQTAPLFWEAHADAAPYLRVPRAGRCPPEEGAIVTTRTHVAEWIDGSALSALTSQSKRRDMVLKALDACFLQLFGTGFVHADMHTGNILYDKDKNLVLLDFGLCTQVSPRQSEAMAIAVAAIISRDWQVLLEAFRDIGLIPKQPFVWVDRVTGERADGLAPGVWRMCDEKEFSDSFIAALDGTDALTFTDITTRLTRLALSYQFILPTWLLFIIRAVLTLDGFAESLKISVLESAAPHAARRVLAPRTQDGERFLRAALLDGNTNRLKLEKLSELVAQIEPSSSSSEGSNALTESVSRLLLQDTDGRALRRLASDVDPKPLVELAATQARRTALYVPLVLEHFFTPIRPAQFNKTSLASLSLRSWISAIQIAIYSKRQRSEHIYRIRHSIRNRRSPFCTWKYRVQSHQRMTCCVQVPPPKHAAPPPKWRAR